MIHNRARRRERGGGKKSLLVQRWRGASHHPCAKKKKEKKSRSRVMIFENGKFLPLLRVINYIIRFSNNFRFLNIVISIRIIIYRPRYQWLAETSAELSGPIITNE